MKCNQSRPGFELVSPCPFPATITITPRAPPWYYLTYDWIPVSWTFGEHSNHYTRLYISPIYSYANHCPISLHLPETKSFYAPCITWASSICFIFYISLNLSPPHWDLCIFLFIRNLDLSYELLKSRCSSYSMFESLKLFWSFTVFFTHFLLLVYKVCGFGIVYCHILFHLFFVFPSGVVCWHWINIRINFIVVSTSSFFFFSFSLLFFSSCFQKDHCCFLSVLWKSINWWSAWLVYLFILEPTHSGTSIKFKRPHYA